MAQINWVAVILIGVLVAAVFFCFMRKREGLEVIGANGKYNENINNAVSHFQENYDVIEPINSGMPTTVALDSNSDMEIMDSGVGVGPGLYGSGRHFSEY